MKSNIIIFFAGDNDKAYMPIDDGKKGLPNQH